jgi:hypothetical protein
LSSGLLVRVGDGLTDEVLIVAMGHNSGRTIPAETARAAWASNPQGTPAMWIRDRLDGLFPDSDFDDWYPADGSPDPTSARVPWSGIEIVSPHDLEARFSHKPGKARWIGSKDHQTETCDEDMPRVIVHVLTTPAPEQDTTPHRPRCQYGRAGPGRPSCQGTSRFHQGRLHHRLGDPDGHLPARSHQPAVEAHCC